MDLIDVLSYEIFGAMIHMIKRSINCMAVAVILVMFFCTVAMASVTTGTESAVNYQMSYPVVHANNEAASMKINSDIEQYLQNFRADYNAGKFINGKISYQVMYEDENYVSILLIPYVWTGGAHGFESGLGLNYDKTSGDIISLPYFVKIDPKDKSMIYSFPTYNDNGKRIPMDRLHENRWEIPISGNYYMLGNGELALIYQPYQLASYADGITHIILTVKWIDYFNRKNQA